MEEADIVVLLPGLAICEKIQDALNVTPTIEVAALAATTSGSVERAHNSKKQLMGAMNQKEQPTNSSSNNEHN
ncbi:hypothetical protein AWZ03_001443 [Drosophila navojoa]|uniref:Uncharacterized protein n=1 Tax=Drosophila navojoa TaxID=7232 RepID=A0A484BVW6_DRONA|nr:hypothetical protein AWZ03_001443 [Drosophila navojoa]